MMAHKKPQSARLIITQLAERLQQVGNPSARRDATLILQMAMSSAEPVLSHHDILLDERAHAELESLMTKRLAGCPVSRLRGFREFYSLDFWLNEATLDPRPDSECLVEAAILHIADNRYHICDFGTGSGCLLIATLAHCKNAKGTGLDLSERAIAQAQENAAYHKLDNMAHFAVSDWDSALQADETFDVILANPPYIPLDEAASLSPEVRDFDPPLALYGGQNGLQAYEILLPIIARRLVPSGHCFLEIGKGQEDDITRFAQKAGLSLVRQIKDLGGIIRCLDFIK